MNYIDRLETEKRIYQEFIKELNSYLNLSKFDHPNDYVQKQDIYIRLSNLWHELGQVN